MRRLRDRGRVDRATNDVRREPGRIGKWIYLGLLFAFFLWLANLFVGPLVRLEADGLVVAETVSIGVPFAAQVAEVAVASGAEVHRSDVLARVDSVDLAQSIATLTARNAELQSARADLERRARISSAVLPIASDRAVQADKAIERVRDVRDNGFVSVATWAQMLAERFTSAERVAELRAEAQAAEQSLSAVNAALDDARQALLELRRAYADGVVRAPDDGIIGLSTAHVGDILTVGQPMMVLYRRPRYVLAYLETGTLYSVSPGDRVVLSDGFRRTTGTVTDVLPVADQLPEEFRKVFKPRGRSQVARIALTDDQFFPLFAKVGASGVGWLSHNSFIRVWLGRTFGSLFQSSSEAGPDGH